MELPTKHTAAVYTALSLPTKHTAVVYTALSPLAVGLPSFLHNNEHFTSKDIRNFP
jgi:hypothetical protein